MQNVSEYMLVLALCLVYLCYQAASQYYVRMRPVVTDVEYVNLSVTIVSPAEPIEMPFGFWTRVGPRNHVFDGSPDPPIGGAILRGKERLIVNYREYRPRVGRCGLLSNYFDHLFHVC